MHALVVQLCNAARVENDRVTIPAENCEMLRTKLPEAYAVEPRVFADLLMVWHTFAEKNYEPAAGQVLELLRILPLLEEQAAALAAEDKAIAQARAGASKPKKPDGLSGKAKLGAVGMRRKT